jgi:hypothetical protein
MQMKRGAQILALCLLLAATGAIAAERDMARPNWDRAAAAAAIDETRVRSELASLFRYARSGQSAELMHEVQHIARDRDRPAPERDYILFQLAAALGELEPQTIDAEIIAYLASTRSRVLVAHEDHPELGVPLYNIRAAASGSMQAWNRHGKQERVQDTAALLQALSSADSAVTAAQVRRARAVLTAEEIEAVLTAVTHIENPGTAALILAGLAPAHLERPAVTNLLFDLLEHRQLGATAGLLLAKSANPAIIERLAETAGGGDSPGARRAQSALETVGNGGQR